MICNLKWGEKSLYTKVEQPMSNHLSAQGRLDPRGGLHCFWCPNKTWTLAIGASDALKIVKNELKFRKVMALQSRGGQEFKL
jgi:hypothetical protein